MTTPKFCTAVNIGRLSNNCAVFNLMYNDTIIESVFLDADHIASLHRTLGSIVNQPAAVTDGAETTEATTVTH